jgi:hypothetical protein
MKSPIWPRALVFGRFDIETDPNLLGRTLVRFLIKSGRSARVACLVTDRTQRGCIDAG